MALDVIEKAIAAVGLFVVDDEGDILLCNW